nr:hypothetical protein [Tanacetum cinerariifolium]
MHRLNVDTLTTDLLAGPTYELMRGSCSCLTKLEYHLEEVYKASTDQLDWVNPEGQQYPHNLLQPLPLIPNNQGRRVIPFEHFINNDLEYLRRGASSRKYTTSVTKTKAGDYGHIKWIEDLNTALPAAQGDAQSWISELTKQADARSSFNELLDTPIDFSNFIMHRLNVDTLTPDLLAGPTYELMRGSCSSLTELEYHLEEDHRGHRVIPFEHFINNDLEYLRGGASSRKYTTSVTKTKAADYGHIKWIKDLVPCEMWIQQPIDYNKHAL